jgi:membrane protein DedA with SNARE-associated domain
MNLTAEFLIRYGYALLFFWILAEQAALPVPSVPLLLACGALIRGGHMHWAPVLCLGVPACLISDSAWFHLGRSRGTKVLRFLCRLALEPDSCVRQTENGFTRFGPRFLLIAKFIPGMSALASPLAGSAGTGWAHFLVLDSIGAALWIASWGSLGYLFRDQVDAIGDIAGRTGLRLFLVIAALLAAWIAFKFFQRRRILRRLATARISAGELHRMLNAGEDVVIIDVRGELAVPRDPIPGALRIPLSTLTSRQQEIPRDRDVVLVCT